MIENSDTISQFGNYNASLGISFNILAYIVHNNLSWIYTPYPFFIIIMMYPSIDS